MQIAKIKPTAYVYNKRQMIGKGSFGEVYLGYSQKDHWPVAVKIVSFEKISAVMNKETLLSKLKQQIINMQIAKNENLVQLLDAQVSSRNLYIICEYCNGESFDSFLKRKGYLTENQAIGFFKEILKGFQNLHNKKIVHRDLKPANLLMHNFNIKVADLGFSKAIDQHEQLLESIVGTPLYMSPQIFNREKYTEKTDIWSLGVILYEMLYGRIPWRAKTLIDLKEKVEKQSVEFPQKPIVSARTKQLIQSMLQLEEKSRVDWQDLFKAYLPSDQPDFGLKLKTSSMTAESDEAWTQACDQMLGYVNKANYIESENQLNKVLRDLGVGPTQDLEYEVPFKTAEQLFTAKSFTDSHKLEILSYCFYFFGRRNRICYLFRVFELLQKIIQDHESRMQSLAPISLYTSMMMIIKFSIHSLYKMLNRTIDTPEEQMVAKKIESGPCLYPDKIKKLLINDYQTLTQFERIFMKDFYEKRMQELKLQNEALFESVNKQLSGFYSPQIGDYKFVKFMLVNNLRSVFSQTKKLKDKKEPENSALFLMTRMVFEFEKDGRLFELGDLLQTFKNSSSLLQGNSMAIKNNQDLNKKYTDWIHDSAWEEKRVSLKEFEIESVSSFINKQFKWNPLHVYAVDILP